MAQHATPKDGCGYGPIRNTTKYVCLSFEKMIEQLQTAEILLDQFMDPYFILCFSFLV